MEITVTTHDEQQTRRVGAQLVSCLPPGTTVALQGPLGAGKTRMVQGAAEQCGVEQQEVNSPTFVICQHYMGQRTIHHVDAYRVNDADEFMELGAEEWFDSDGITFVEWADRFPDLMPERSVFVTLVERDRDIREIQISSECADLHDALMQLQNTLAAS